MLAIFNSSVVTGPEELRAPGDRSPGIPRKNAACLLSSFVAENTSAISVQIADHCSLGYSRDNSDLFKPRSFGAKDDIFCLFKGVLENLPSLRQQYGLSKSVNEVTLMIEAYKTLRDRAPYPASHVVGHLEGQFAFVLFDRSTCTVFAANDSEGRIPFFWGITADSSLAFSDDAELLRSACGKSLATFPQGCMFSTDHGLSSFENPKNKVTAVPTMEEEIYGTKFEVDRQCIFAGISMMTSSQNI